MPGTHNAAALMYEGSWETTSLMRDLTAVSDRPNDSFIESACGLAPRVPSGRAADTRDEYWQDRLSAFTATHKRAIREYLRFMQSALAGERYDEHLSRALRVWES